VKTISLKKVAVVAVASLGFGLTSVVPVNAAEEAAGQTLNITLANATSANTVGSPVYVNFMAKMTTIADLAQNNTVTFSSGLTQYPTGGFVQVTANADATGLDGAALADTEIYVATGGGAPVIANAGTAGSTFVTTIDGGAGVETYTAVATAASATVAAATFSFTPSVAGDYVLRVWHDAATAGTLNYNEMFTEIKITVAERSGASASLSTVQQADQLLPAAGTFAPDATTDATIYSTTAPAPSVCAKGTAQCANLLVTVKDSANRAISTGWTFAAEISGAGNLGISDTNNTYTQAASSRSVSVPTPADNVFNVAIWGDNTAGDGTVTVTATNATTGAKTTLGTKKVSFYGTLAKLEVVAGSQNYKVLKAGKGTATGIVTGLTATSDTPALVLKATDSGGRSVASQSITATPSDVAIVSGSTANEALVARDAGYLYGGRGYYLVDVTSAASSTSGQTAKVTYSVTLSTGTVISTTADFTIGGSVATEVISFDKTSYSPGEPMNVTITAKDSAGNPVFDGAASPALTFSKAVSGTFGTSTYLAGKKSSTSSKGVPSIYAPSIGGSFSANGISNNAAGSAITASSSVADANAGLLTQIDALNAKIVALNALIAKIMKKLGVK
jgi:hypothetical protein